MLFLKRQLEKTNNALFCSLSLTLLSLFTRGRKLVGSRRKVISREARNWFMPVRSDCGGVAVAAMAGLPSKTMTRSAKYVAMMKSCSMINAVFFACRTKRLMTLLAMIRCSESRNLGRMRRGRKTQLRLAAYELGSSMRYTCTFGLPRARTIATRCNSPPERVLTSWSIILSRLICFNTSVWN